MFTRIVTFTGATDIDAGVRYLQDTVVPLLRKQRGHISVAASRPLPVKGIRLSLLGVRAAKCILSRSRVGSRRGDDV
jgi:hypothetical protein